jgi:hypothetical protein
MEVLARITTGKEFFNTRVINLAGACWCGCLAPIIKRLRVQKTNGLIFTDDEDLSIDNTAVYLFFGVFRRFNLIETQQAYQF